MGAEADAGAHLPGFYGLFYPLRQKLPRFRFDYVAPSSGRMQRP